MLNGFFYKLLGQQGDLLTFFHGISQRNGVFLAMPISSTGKIQQAVTSIKEQCPNWGIIKYSKWIHLPN